MSTSLKVALSLERSRLFVGRQAECERVRDWLQHPDAPTEIIFVSGMGGIGKSALLLQLLNLAHEGEVLCIWLDGRSCTESPAAFLDAIHSYLFQPSHVDPSPKAPMLEVAESIAKQRTLLCIDNYDSINHIEGWLREVFLPELPATELLIVLAARQHLTMDWENDLAWRGRFTHMRLEPISREEARRYYANLGLGDTPDVERLIHDTHGHPLAMALAADRLNRVGQTADADWPVWHRVSSALWREVATPDLHELLDILCIIPQASQESLNRLLPIPLTLSQLHQFTKLSFVRPTTIGLALHDVARAHLLEDFMRREPKRYETLRRRIVDELCRTLRMAERHAKGQIAASLMSICRDAFSFHSDFGFSTNPDATAFDPYHRQDLPHLHRLIEEEEFQKATTLASARQAHELLDAVAEHFPEGIYVFRSGDGIPLVFRAGLLLYRETCSFLQSYLPHMLEACYPADAPRMKQLPREEADTYYHFLGGADHHHADHTFHELYGYMFTDGFARTMGAGIRLSFTTRDDRLRNSLQSLGCQTRLLRNLPPAHPACEDLVLEFDLRSGDFGEWVRSSLEQRRGQRIHGNAEVTGEDVKGALQVYEDTVALDSTKLAQWMNCTGQDLRDILWDIMRKGSTVYSQSERAVLNLLCTEPSLSANAASVRLNMSRSTYYRHLRNALDRTVQALNEQDNLHVK